MRYHRRMARIAFAVLLGLLIVACGDGDGGRPVPTGGTLPATEATATPAGETTATPPRDATATPSAELPTPTEDGESAGDTACTREETRAPVIAACEVLAELFGRSLGEIDTVTVTPREWPNSCLGLAESDEVCAQVITPGFEVVLVLLDARSLFTYRTDETTHVRLQEFDLSPD